MASSLVICDGVRAGLLWLPPFELVRGEQLCLHMPGPADYWVKRPSGSCSDRPGTKSRISHLWAHTPLPLRRSYEEQPDPACFTHPRAVAWLQRNGQVSRETAEKTVCHIEQVIQKEIYGFRIAYMPWIARIMLGLEAVWAHDVDVVVYDLVGLDQCGKETVYAAIASALGNCASVHLCYETFRLYGRPAEAMSA